MSKDKIASGLYFHTYWEDTTLYERDTTFYVWCDGGADPSWKDAQGHKGLDHDEINTSEVLKVPKEYLT